ncbi:RNA polymerase sigma factor [Pedobacter africanus]|uniref:RNA polymerase sigma-70 factor, ECF subfamily n=1 Tax=Pedobacter africanus TaxID=151894 RepID=A0A1W2A3W3_9SPHI|nr:RNA polymerase sigma-70 factor [Pedobacter africanus]SMC55365.1 RNA polymerase sigma-70 factor, ECF subfamily [Pedobacter africanus]
MNIYSTHNDLELVALLKEGNEAAFAEIYERYHRLLYLYAYRKLKDDEDTKDLVQEVFTWLWNQRKNFELKTTLAGYLYKMVLNRVFDIFKHKNIVHKYIESGQHFIEIDSTETDYLIREKDIAGLIAREIAAMPPKMREIFELKNKAFLSTKEIASQLEISEHTVSTQLKRASKHLRTKLGIVVWLLYLLGR